MSTEIDEKTGRLVRWMEGRRLGGVLLSTRASFAWITATPGWPGLEIEAGGRMCAFPGIAVLGNF